MKRLIADYKKEQEAELRNILNYWMNYSIDKINGGFYGKIDDDNIVDKEAPKGSVLNSRILWTFSAAFNQTKNRVYLEVADRAFNYIINHFVDHEHGGVYWSVDYKGNPLDTKKQTYALAFALYGLSEYVKASGNALASRTALEMYGAIESHSFEKRNGGYIEALTRDWQEIKDLRLSAKDANEPKSMNTHLHLLEAYANLYRVCPSGELKETIAALIQLFLHHIIDRHTNHLVLFFDDDWQRRSHIISYGHDIEAAWLVQEAAEAINDEELIEEVKKCSVLIAEASLEGLDEDGGLWYEFEIDKQHLIKEKHWWPQAEAMVGFFNAFQISGSQQFLQQSLKSWQFVKKHILNKDKGEWFWGVKENDAVMVGEDKVGLWKCPYHNSRACMEIIRRSEDYLAGH